VKGVFVGLLGATGVAAGAFGAHALDGRVTPARIAVWETAARYHLIHAVVLLVLLAHPSVWPFRLLAAGTLVFATSLYLLVLLDLPVLGAVTPVGGVLLIAGWVTLAAALRARGPSVTLRG
jgi:uncharacterized membrane protein YgdD (TMEM256/DUF423 family)